MALALIMKAKSFLKSAVLAAVAAFTFSSATVLPAHAEVGYLTDARIEGTYLVCTYRISTGYVDVRMTPGRSCPSSYNF